MKTSIITVCLNNRDTIGSAIESVLSQSHKDLEYIVIDGGSTDGTLQVVESYGNRISSLVSEPDSGIYDAMNKGIASATGEVVGILNADDCYADDRVLERVAYALASSDADACYGDLVYTDALPEGKTRRFWRAGIYEPRSFYYGWMPPHPTFFVKRTHYSNYGLYRLDMGSAADYELMLRYLVRYKLKPAYLSEVLVIMRSGGASNATVGNRLKAHAMDWKAWMVNGLLPLPWTLPMKPLRKISQWFVRS